MQQSFSTIALEEAFDADGAREIIQSFLDDSSDLIKLLDDTIKEREQEKLRSISHKLRGCCRAISAHSGQKLCSRMEELAAQLKTQEDWLAVEALQPILEESYAAIAERARQYLNVS